MRILLDTTFALRGPSGTAVYLDELERALRALGVDVTTASNERRGGPGGGSLASARNLGADLIWARRRLGGLARRCGADVIHHPLPAHAPGADVAQVVTVHDVAFQTHPELFDRRFRMWASRAHRNAARRADAVVCVSAETARAAQRHWDVDPERIVLAKHGPGQTLPFRARPAEPLHLLYVGDNEPRKRVDMLRAAHAVLRARLPGVLPLVLVGNGHAPGPDVEVVSRATPGRLADLYAAAALLVHPAAVEGFGLTVLEAMTAGTPVLAAASAVSREVCGDAAVLTDAGDADALAAEVELLLGDPGRRSELAARGHAQVAQYSWERCAGEHLRAYTLALR